VEEKSLIIQKEMQTNLSIFDQKLLATISNYNLPIENIFADINERTKVFKNLEEVILFLDKGKRINAVYISKFIAAVASGLFDAALNYLWDETIVQLRNRVSQYDIQYFYDTAVNSEKRNKLNSIEDLEKVDDSELIFGCKEIGLISKIGFNLLEHIKFMRNWASAAHPNQIELTGLQLIEWLETCIKQVICLPITSVTIETNKLLANIKNSALNSADAVRIRSFFIELPDEKVEALANGFFGIYTRLETTQQTRQNISMLASDLWGRLSEDAKNKFGIRYAQFAANGEKKQENLARSFLEQCNGEKYIPENIRAAEINELLQGLRKVHNEINNFYNEPIFARQLVKLCKANIPEQCVKEFVNTIIYVYITNGHGVCWSADMYYVELIKSFNQNQSMRAGISFIEDDIANKLSYPPCLIKYLEMLEMIKQNITAPMFLNLIEDIKKFKNLSVAKEDNIIKNKINLIRPFLKNVQT